MNNETQIRIPMFHIKSEQANVQAMNNSTESQTGRKTLGRSIGNT